MTHESFRIYYGNAYVFFVAFWLNKNVSSKTRKTFLLNRKPQKNRNCEQKSFDKTHSSKNLKGPSMLAKRSICAKNQRGLRIKK